MVRDYWDYLRKLAQQDGRLNPADELLRDYEFWKERTLFQQYCEWRMEKEKLAQTEVNAWPSPFRNGKKGEPYQIDFVLPEVVEDYEFIGLDKAGLNCRRDEKNPRKCHITGTPPKTDARKADELDIVLRYRYKGWTQGMRELERTFRLAINPDPRDLWNDIETPENIEYYRPDTAKEYMPARAGADDETNSVDAILKNLVAASVRGRSHAHEGKPRDDDFKMLRDETTGWHIVAVSDGAGSAPFSREGARIACQTAVQHCHEALAQLSQPELELFHSLAPDSEAAKDLYRARRMMYDRILGQAALKAHKAIREEAQSKKREIKQYAATLLLAVCRKFKLGWFVAYFSVGDGALGLLHGDKTAELLAEPDEGEYSGQTRFITMEDIFRDGETFYKRVQARVVSGFEAIILMTDGVSDAKFGTDAMLHDPQRWLDLWQDLQGAVFSGAPQNQQEAADPGVTLRDWLNFWSPGNHDDRTIAIVY